MATRFDHVGNDNGKGGVGTSVALAVLIRHAADGAEGAVRLPSPDAVAHRGRAVRRRRRVTAAACGTVAAGVLAFGSVGLAAGAWTMPWLQGGSASVAGLTATAGTAVGDAVNALDPRFGTAAFGTHDWLTFGDREAQIDLGGEGREGWISVTVANRTTEPAAPVKAHVVTGTRGDWSLVRSGALDGWLLVAMLPAGGSAVQARVTGTDFLLPLDSAGLHHNGYVACVADTSDTNPDEGTLCTYAPEDDDASVLARFATSSAEPPVDELTYVNAAGEFVTLPRS